MTGGEAMYADMGHIGRNPIRTSWYGIVLPALLLNSIMPGKSRSTSAIRRWMAIRSSGWHRHSAAAVEFAFVGVQVTFAGYILIHDA
jgi:hypothetical protein